VKCGILIRAIQLCEFTKLTMSSTLLIPQLKPINDAHEETIKWSYGNSKYEIYTPILEDLELKVLRSTIVCALSITDLPSVPNRHLSLLSLSRSRSSPRMSSVHVTFQSLVTRNMVVIRNSHAYILQKRNSCAQDYIHLQWKRKIYPKKGKFYKGRENKSMTIITSANFTPPSTIRLSGTLNQRVIHSIV
jgi:hypothetical protein